VSPASDVFSFGATLFECLSLERPFAGRTSADVLSAVLNSDAPLLRRVEKGTPWELEAIADKCLRRCPAERYPSAGSLANDLRNYLELRPVSARPIGKIGRVGRMILRRPWVATTFFVLAFSAMSAMVLANQAWEEYKAEKVRSAKHEQELAKHAEEEFEAEKIRTIAKRVDEGDAALFRCLSGQQPTWLPAVVEKYRQEGISAYSAALKLDPDAVRPLVQRARLHAAKKETLELALADQDKAQKLKPGFGSIRKFRGTVLDELGRNEEGRVAREEAKSRYPTAAEDLYWLGVIAHTLEQDFLACYSLFSQALLLAPNDYWSRLERAYYGRIPSEENVRQRVIPELEIAKTIRPDLPFASELLVQFFATDRSHGYVLDPQRQKKELTDQIERFGLDIHRAHKMSELLQMEKQFDEAEAILGKVLDQDTGGVTAERIGDLEYRLGHHKQSRDWYRRAIGEGTRYPMAYKHLADACTATKDWKGAERAYLDGIAVHPQRPFLYALLGNWYEQRGRDVDAETAYRKGCELPCDFAGSSPSSAESSGQVRDLASCFQSLARLVGQSGRNEERLKVLEKGIARLETALASANQAQKESVEECVSSLKRDLGQAFLLAGRRQEAVSFVNAELKKKPLRPADAQGVIDLMRMLGMQQEALEAARLAEFVSENDSPSNDRSSRQHARSLVDGQLQRMGLYKELFNRLETRRALGDELSEEAYGWYVFYQGADAASIVGEGVKKHPDSVPLHSHHMELLAKAGRKEEAWKAYVKGRDLYFARLDKSQIPALPVASQAIELPLLPPTAFALPWFTYLLQEGEEEEFRSLEDRLREACLKTKTDAKSLMLPRATAEFATRRFSDAAESFQFCVEHKLWNEFASEAMVTAGLARSLRLSGQRKDAINSYKRAVQVSGVHPSLFSEYLCLAVEVGGVDGFLREFSTFDMSTIGTDVRRLATTSCFMSWVSLPMGNEKAAREHLAQAGSFVRQASQQPEFSGDEGLVCGVILQIVADKLADANQSAFATGLLKRYPAERISAMRKVFALPKKIPGKTGVTRSVVDRSPLTTLAFDNNSSVSITKGDFHVQEDFPDGGDWHSDRARWPASQCPGVRARLHAAQRDLRCSALSFQSRPQLPEQLEHVPEHQPVHGANGNAAYSEPFAEHADVLKAEPPVIQYSELWFAVERQPCAEVIWAKLAASTNAFTLDTRGAGGVRREQSQCLL
jgi:tetratricopeptide (TPR) repeat protein